MSTSVQILNFKPPKRLFTLMIDVTVNSANDIFIEEFSTTHTVEAVNQKDAMRKLREHYRNKNTSEVVYAICLVGCNPHIK